MPNNNSDGADMIQSAEAAQILGLTQSTFNRRVAAGAIIPAVTLAGPTGARLFRRSDIERIAAEQVAA